MKLFKIVIANIRRRKSGAVTFLVMSLIAAVMLCIAFSLTIGMNTFYDQKHQELKGTHYTVTGQRDLVSAFAKEEIEDSPYVKEWREEPAYMLQADFVDTSKKNMFLLFMKARDFENSSQLPLHYIDAADTVPKNGVVIPLGYKSEGVKIGDKIKLKSRTDTYEFQVYAFFEDIEFGASTTNINKIFYYDDSKEMMAESGEFIKSGYLTVSLKKASELNAFTKSLNVHPEFTGATYTESKSASEAFVNIISSFLLLFSILVLIIALIVVRFSIVVSMSEDMITVGSLKSIGYTNRQLILAQLLQYGGISVIGSAVGMSISAVIFPYLGNVVAGATGLMWESDVNWGAMLLSVLLIMILCELMILIMVQRIRKITPVNALRQGDSHHSFKRNPLPLSKHGLPLIPHLALKNCIRGVRTNITLLIVIASLSLISAIGFIVNYNIDHPKAFYDMVGFDDAHYVCMGYDDFREEVEDELKTNPAVKNTIYCLQGELTVNDVTANSAVYRDFSESTAKNLYEGRKPTADNEVALGTSIADETGKTIGDTVTVEAYGVSHEYIVVGLVQGLSDGGRTVLATLDAMKNHDENVSLNMVYVMLKSDELKKEFNDGMIDKFGTSLLIVDELEMMESVFEPMGVGIKAAVYMMLVTSAFVISFILFFVISGIIRREKKNFGIMKAIGYTNGQIILQILLTYLPAIIIGCILGAVCSTSFANDFLSIMFKAVGLSETFFVVPAMQNVFICLALFVVAVLVIFLVAFRTKNISAHKLITEQ